MIDAPKSAILGMSQKCYQAVKIRCSHKDPKQLEHFNSVIRADKAEMKSEWFNMKKDAKHHLFKPKRSCDYYIGQAHSLQKVIYTVGRQQRVILYSNLHKDPRATER